MPSNLTAQEVKIHKRLCFFLVVLLEGKFYETVATWVHDTVADSDVPCSNRRKKAVEKEAFLLL